MAASFRRALSATAAKSTVINSTAGRRPLIAAPTARSMASEKRIRVM